MIAIVGSVFIVAIAVLIVAIVHHNKENKKEKTGINIEGQETGYSNDVVLGEYIGLTYSPYEIEVTDEDVEKYIATLLASTPNYEVDYSKDGTTPVSGDTLEVTVTITLTTDTVATVTDKTMLLTIGEGTLGAALDEVLLNTTVGSTFEAVTTVPDTYSNSEIAGKECNVSGTINYAVTLFDTVTDSYVNTQTNGECTSAADFNDYVYNKLLENEEKAAEEDKWNQIWTKLIDNCEITVDDANVDAEYQDMIDYYESYASYLGTTVSELATEAYGYSTLQDFYDYCREYASEIVKEQAVYDAIIAKEGISVTVGDDVYNEKVLEYMEEGDYDSVSDLENVVGQDELVKMAKNDLVSELLLSNAVEVSE